MIHTSLCRGAFHNWIFSIAFCDCHQFDGPCLKGQLHFDPHSRVVSSITLLSSHGTMESGTDDVLRWNIRYAKMNCSLCTDILLRCYSIMFNITDALPTLWLQKIRMLPIGKWKLMPFGFQWTNGILSTECNVLQLNNAQLYLWMTMGRPYV